MATIIGLPKLSPTMEEGVLAKWYKKEGDQVSPGDIIAEVETDKANMDFPLEDEGTLLKLLVKEGDTVKLGAPVAILGEAGEDIAGVVEEAQRQMTGGGAPAQPAEPAAEAPAPAQPEPEVAAKPPAAPAQPAGNGRGKGIAEGAAEPPRPTEGAEASRPATAQPTTTPGADAHGAGTTAARPATVAGPAQRPGGDGHGQLLASPIAKTLAAEHGVDLRNLRGSGPGGRIVERDVLAALEQPAAPEPPSGEGPPAPAARRPAARPAAPPPVAEGEEFTDKSLSMMRKTIARRLVEAKAPIPHFYLTADCDAGPLVSFRTALNEIAGEEHKVSLNDLIVKASAIALRRVPTANASFLGDRIRYHGRVHVGVAVAIEDGLLTPVVRDVDTKGLLQISAEVKELAGRARAKKLAPEEMTGGTFTVSNLGMFGIDHFQAILNPPEACILAVGAVRKQPVVGAGDRIEVGQRMALTLSCDHRVVDGALGARLLAELVKILERPAALAL